MSEDQKPHAGRYYLFDIETDGLHRQMTKIHCLVLYDLNTDELIVCEGETRFGKNSYSIEEGLELMRKAEGLCGHNIIGFDLPGIKLLYPDFDWSDKKLYDTLVMSKLTIPQLKAKDFDTWKRGELDGANIGRHGLEAWGQRLGNQKTDYKAWAKENGIKEEDIFKVYTKEMLDYCIQDVRVNVDLFKLLRKKKCPPDVVALENRMARMMQEQEALGFPFRFEEAKALFGEISALKLDAELAAKDIFKPWFVKGEEVNPSVSRKLAVTLKEGEEPKSWQDYGTRLEPRFHKTTGKPLKPAEVAKVYEEYTAGAPYTRVKLTKFNPSSRPHIIDRLINIYGWQPTEQTEDGQWKLDDTTLQNLDYPVAQFLSEAFLLSKRAGQIGDGKQAWLNQAVLGRDGIYRIHGRCDPLGTGTARATHSSPNLGQVPSKKNAKGVVRYGEECRSLFYAPSPYVMVGCDASGLELRLLAHYLHPYDGGAYGPIVCDGDVHTANQSYANLATRDIAKRWAYAYLYGSGNFLLGAIAGITDEEIEEAKSTKDWHNVKTVQYAKRAFEKDGLPFTDKNFATYLKGMRQKKEFTKNFPGLSELQLAFKYEFDNNERFLKALDGRHLYARSPHSVLNFKLQSAGAIVCKRWLVIMEDAFAARGWIKGQHWAPCAWVHDETQFLILPELADEAGQLAADCVRLAGEYYHLNVPLAGEFKVGSSWAETH